MGGIEGIRGKANTYKQLCGKDPHTLCLPPTSVWDGIVNVNSILQFKANV
jgi:hypothetical protein